MFVSRPGHRSGLRSGYILTPSRLRLFSLCSLFVNCVHVFVQEFPRIQEVWLEFKSKMAESAGRRKEEKTLEENESRNEEGNGGEKEVSEKKVSKPRSCRTCKVLLKEHDGPWGSKCKNKDLIDLNDKQEDEEDDPEEEDIGQEEDESSEATQSESSGSEESEPEPEPQPVKKKDKKKAKKKVVHAKKKKAGGKEKETSTPRNRRKRRNSIPALSFVAGNVDKSILEALSDRLEQMDATVKEMNRRWENEMSRNSDREVLINSRDNRDIRDNIRDNTYQIRDDVQLLSGVSEAQKDLLDMGIVLHDTGTQHQQPVPGLIPVSDQTDVRHLKPHPGIPDRMIRQILQGEYCDISLFLKPEIEAVKEETYETLIQNGQLMCKVKEKKRDINSIVTWFEAWAYYEMLMGEFHGWQAYKPLHAYKLRILEWNKKYTWSSVYSWDVELRRDKAGKTISFVEYDAGLFAHHFDQSTYRQKKNQDEGKSKPTTQQPFRGGPGATAGTGHRQQGPGMGQYRYSAARPEACYFYNTSECYSQNCRRPHYCKQCAGPMPYFECCKSGRCSYSYARYS